MKELEAISFIVHENSSGSGGGGGDGQSATLFAVDWMGLEQLGAIRRLCWVIKHLW